MGSLFSFLWEWGVEVLLTSYTRFVMKSQKDKFCLPPKFSIKIPFVKTSLPVRRMWFGCDSSKNLLNRIKNGKFN